MHEVNGKPARSMIRERERDRERKRESGRERERERERERGYSRERERERYSRVSRTLRLVDLHTSNVTFHGTLSGMR